MQFRQWHDDLWTVDMPFRYLSMSFGNRMTIVRCGKALLLHSPVRYSRELAEQVAALGDIRYLLSPNLMHDLFFDEWRDAYPQARVIAPPQASKLAADITLADGEDAALDGAWRHSLVFVAIAGMPRLHEYALLHLPSNTLVLTDLVFHIQPPIDSWSKFMFTLYGAYGKFGPTRLMRALIEDKPRFASSLQELNKYDFDRVIMSHGHIIERDGKTLFNGAFADFMR